MGLNPVFYKQICYTKENVRIKNLVYANDTGKNSNQSLSHFKEVSSFHISSLAYLGRGFGLAKSTEPFISADVNLVNNNPFALFLRYVCESVKLESKRFVNEVMLVKNC